MVYTWPSASTNACVDLPFLSEPTYFKFSKLKVSKVSLGLLKLGVFSPCLIIFSRRALNEFKPSAGGAT